MAASFWQVSYCTSLLSACLFSDKLPQEHYVLRALSTIRQSRIHAHFFLLKSNTWSYDS